MDPISTNAAIKAVIIAIHAAIAAEKASHAATIATLVLHSKERVKDEHPSDLIEHIEALPVSLKDHVMEFVKPSLGPFSMTSGSWTFTFPDWTVKDSLIRLELTARIPDPGIGYYILKIICQVLRDFATNEFPLLDDRHYEFERVDCSVRWTTPSVPTVRTPICFEWSKLKAEQDEYGWWAMIGCRLSLYNKDGRWTSRRLESITSLVNEGLNEAIEREEEQPYYDDPYERYAYDDFGDIGDGDY